MPVVLSSEQRRIVQAVLVDNVVCNAFPGTGKSETELHAVDKYLEQNVDVRAMIVVYNKALQQDTQRRCATFPHHKRMLITTVDALLCCQGQERQKRYMSTKKHNRDWKNVAMVVIDEAQDMTPFLLDILRYAISFSSYRQSMRYLIIGDVFQTIRPSTGDQRPIPQLLLRPDLYLDAVSFKRHYLQRSYRCPKRVCNTINELLHPKRLRYWYEANKWCVLPSNCTSKVEGLAFLEQLEDVFGDGMCSAVDDFAGDVVVIDYESDTHSHMRSDVVPLLKQRQKHRSEFIALFTTVKDRTPASVLTREMENHAWISINAKTSKEERFRRNKYAISTVHQQKGLTHPHVYMCYDGFEKSQYGFDPFVAFCLNFVAMSRASHSLLISRNTTNRFATDPLRSTFKPYTANTEFRWDVCDDLVDADLDVFKNMYIVECDKLGDAHDRDMAVEHTYNGLPIVEEISCIVGLMIEENIERWLRGMCRTRWMEVFYSVVSRNSVLRRQVPASVFFSVW